MIGSEVVSGNGAGGLKSAPLVSSEREVGTQKHENEANQYCEAELSSFNKREHGGIIGPGY